MLVSLLAFPIRLGSSTAEEIPSSGRAVAVSADLPASDESVVGIPVARYARPVRVDGLPAGEDPIIVPLAVAAAMRELGIQHGGQVFTPQILREEGGVKYAPGLVYHPDISGPMTETVDRWLHQQETGAA